MLRKTVLARALQVAFTAGALSMAVAPTVMAQSNAAGSVYGKITAGSGDTIILKSNDTNQARTSSIEPNGTFRVTNLPLGNYTATLQKGGNVVSTTTLDVIAGQGVEAVFATAGMTSVQVTGRRSRIDISNSTNGATFSARELEKLPIARNVEAIVQLAPNTTRGDPTYSAGASFGGGGASENAYYINGFPATNPLTQLGAMELPFGAIAQATVLTGGYGVEFGRSVGGVMNITTKSGTNTWEAGGYASITPASTRAKYQDYYYGNTGAFPVTATTPNGTDNTLRLRREDNQVKQTQYSAYVGGPIIQDKLFMFAALEQTSLESNGVYLARTALTLDDNGWRDYETKTNRYFFKLDYNITDNHRLEFTTLGDLPETDTQYRSYDYTTRAVGNTVNSATHEEYGPFNPNGGEAKILRYVGNLTDDLTVTALFGKSEAEHIYTPEGYNPTLAQVSALPDTQVPGLNYSGGQPFSDDQPFTGARDEVISKRLDIEYRIGNHTLKAGIDNNKMKSMNAGDQRAGGVLWTYGRTPTPSQPFAVAGGTVPALASLGGYAAQGYYVSRNRTSTVSNAFAGQDAQYLEDRWQVTKDVAVTVGVRREGFYNANQDGTKYIEMKNQIAPRASAVWDVNGDASFKVFGSAGRYTVQMPTMIALRGANGSLNADEYFAYTGTDANGAPTGLTPLTGVLSANSEFGQAKDPVTVAAMDMKPSFQDELTLGLEKMITPEYNFGAKATYRKLKSTIDDLCDGRPFEAYAAANNIAVSDDWHFACASFNPGEANDFMVDYGLNGNYTKVHLTKEALGFEEAKRTYAALDFFLEHPYRNGWYAKVNYTLSRSKGNTEGQTLSDTSTGQGDVAATQTWDYKELMDYAYGLLPNDRKHQVKAIGYYDVTPEITVGGAAVFASGRPRSCSGTNPNTVGTDYNYQSASHYCFGATGSQNTPSPRGTVGRLPWEKTVDLNVVYRPTFFKGLALKVDVFNVLNDQNVQKVYERYNTNQARYALYEAQIYRSAPRSARFSAEYNIRFN